MFRIAGPTLAYWLHRYGFAVTVVERSNGVRIGGYPIDVRGAAIDVVERMGLLPSLRTAHIPMSRITFVDRSGAAIAVAQPDAVTGSVAGRHLEVPRGVLTQLLHVSTRAERIRYIFGDMIDRLEDEGDAVDVRFRSGRRERFDVVVGADGLHSATRAMTFGPEARFDRYLGWRFNLFSLPNDTGYSYEGIILTEPARMAGLYATDANDPIHAFLVFADREAAQIAPDDFESQRRRTAEKFARDGWEVPRLLEAMQLSDDLFFDTVSQVQMPAWSKGRIGLVGDAAYAPSFLSGQGTSLALVGAYILAGELAIGRNPADALAAYERRLRPYVEANQALATAGGSLLLPQTQEELDRRNRLLAAGDFSSRGGGRAHVHRQAHEMISLPDYEALL